MQNTFGGSCEAMMGENEQLLQGNGSLKEEVNSEFYDFHANINLIFLDKTSSNSSWFFPICSVE